MTTQLSNSMRNACLWVFCILVDLYILLHFVHTYLCKIIILDTFLVRLYYICIMIIRTGICNIGMSDGQYNVHWDGTQELYVIVKEYIIIYCSSHISLSKAFWRWFFYYLLFLAETFMMCVNVFYITRNNISVGSDKKWEFSP